MHETTRPQEDRPMATVTIAPLHRERRLTTSLAHPTWASGETPADQGWFAQVTLPSGDTANEAVGARPTWSGR